MANQEIAYYGYPLNARLVGEQLLIEPQDDLLVEDDDKKFFSKIAMIVYGKLSIYCMFNIRELEFGKQVSFGDMLPDESKQSNKKPHLTLVKSITPS